MDKKCSICNGTGRRIIPVMIGKAVCPITQVCTSCNGTGNGKK